DTYVNTIRDDSDISIRQVRLIMLLQKHVSDFVSGENSTFLTSSIFKGITGPSTGISFMIYLSFYLVTFASQRYQAR
ncbi:hypothetical protein SEEM841_18115, partial [Salmonella enterica subsp. enterica serovar Senftenberg str. 423984-1]